MKQACSIYKMAYTFKKTVKKELSTVNSKNQETFGIIKKLASVEKKLPSLPFLEF